MMKWRKKQTATQQPTVRKNNKKHTYAPKRVDCWQDGERWVKRDNKSIDLGVKVSSPIDRSPSKMLNSSGLSKNMTMASNPP